jgi:hypothetical protein
VPINAVACCDPLCDNALHSADFNTFADLISEACIESAKASLPHTGRTGRKPVPDWTEHVEPARQHSIFWHRIWLDCDRPKTCLVADIMRRTRAAYHYSIRNVQRNEHAIITQRFAASVLKGNNRNLWSEVKRISGSKTAPANTIDGESSPENIARISAEKYQDLYNSVPYNVKDNIDVKNVGEIIKNVKKR